MGFTTRDCVQDKSCSVEHKAACPQICVAAILQPIPDFRFVSDFSLLAAGDEHLQGNTPGSTTKTVGVLRQACPSHLSLQDIISLLFYSVNFWLISTMPSFFCLCQMPWHAISPFLPLLWGAIWLLSSKVTDHSFSIQDSISLKSVPHGTPSLDAQLKFWAMQ
jgi:hypothetical protein